MQAYQAYKEAIDIIVSNNFDAREIAIKLAKENPDLFVAIVRGSNAVKEPTQVWYKTARRLILAGQKVEGIKMIRNETGLGLKEAKDVADAVIEYSHYGVYNIRNVTMSGQLQQLAISIFRSE